MQSLSEVLYNHKFSGDEFAFPSFLHKNERLPTSFSLIAKLEGHRGCINTCSFNPFGDQMLTGSDDGCVWLWDISSNLKQPKVMLRPHATNLFTANFLCSNRFVSGANDANVEVVDIGESCAVATEYENHHQRKVVSSFIIDDHTFATCSADETIRLFDTRQSYPGSSVRELPFLTENDLQYDSYKRLTDDLEKFHLFPQGKGGGKIGVLPPSHDESLLYDLRGTGRQFFQMDVHPIDHRRFLASCGDGTVRLLDLRTIGIKNDSIGFSVREHYGSEMEITGATFDYTGERIAASVLKGDIHIFETDKAQEIKKWEPPTRTERRRTGGNLEINLTDFVNEDGTINLNEIQEYIQNAGLGRAGDYEEEEEEEQQEEETTKEIPGCIKTLRGHRSQETVKSVNWLGDFVVSGSDNGIIYIFNPETGKVIKVLNGHKGNVNVVSVHREKKLLATSGIDYYAMLWGPNTFTEFDEESNEIEVNEALENARNAGGSSFECNVM